MEIPAKIDQWTFETVREIVQHHDFEPGLFDFKAALRATHDASKSDLVSSIRRTACAMANGLGGYIIFGVLDRKRLGHGSAEDLITGIPIDGELRKEFGEKIADIQPEIYFEATPKALILPANSQRGVFVVHVPQSPRRPHMVETAGVFYQRGQGGSARSMSYVEVRDQMLMTEERMRKVRLFRLQLAKYREMRELLMRKSFTIEKVLIRFDIGSYMPLLADIMVVMPHDDQLLRDLLDLPTHLDQINRNLDFLNQAIFHDSPASPQARQGILEQLQFFVQDCQACEDRLLQIFGPIV
jgi:hypothetical protein